MAGEPFLIDAQDFSFAFVGCKVENHEWNGYEMLAPARHDGIRIRIRDRLRLQGRPITLRERAGVVGGALMVPWVAAGSYLRGARLFHPEGSCYAATVAAATTEQPYASAAARLQGEALVRLSAALWRESEIRDILGFTIRFQIKPTAESAPGDQDLLLATVRSPVLLFSALMTTRSRDFLANIFYGVSPFDIVGVGRVKIRLVPLHGNIQGRNRIDIIAQAMNLGLAVFRLEVRPLHKGLGFKEWKPLVEVRLQRRLYVDQEMLRFSPFRNGRGIEPRGFIHYLRQAVYPASQFIRLRKKEEYV